MKLLRAGVELVAEGVKPASATLVEEEVKGVRVEEGQRMKVGEKGSEEQWDLEQFGRSGERTHKRRRDEVEF